MGNLTGLANYTGMLVLEIKDTKNFSKGDGLYEERKVLSKQKI